MRNVRHSPNRFPWRAAFELAGGVFFLSFLAVTLYLSDHQVYPISQSIPTILPPLHPPSAPTEIPLNLPPPVPTLPSPKPIELPVIRSPLAGPQPVPVALPSPKPSSADDWLSHLNYYRVLAGLLPVTADVTLSAGDELHTRYLLKTHMSQIRTGRLDAEAHTEDPSDPWYSAAGLDAAEHSDFAGWWGNQRLLSPYWALDNWIDTAFHRLWLLNPALHRVGYGTYCEADACEAGLNVWAGVDRLAMVASEMPVEFPPDGSVIPNGSLANGEWPNPITACSGYNMPVGLPITLQLGARKFPRVTSWSLTSRAGDHLEACEFTAANYSNPDLTAQGNVLRVLREFGAVVLVPRAPLETGETYFASIVTDSGSYRWSFSIGPLKPLLVKNSNATAAMKTKRSPHAKRQFDQDTSCDEYFSATPPPLLHPYHDCVAKLLRNEHNAVHHFLDDWTLHMSGASGSSDPNDPNAADGVKALVAMHHEITSKTAECYPLLEPELRELDRIGRRVKDPF
jgi:Cysteine-rich secretory protein family